MDHEKMLAQSLAISKIAFDLLGIKTFDIRNSDQLDFYDLSVGSIKAALDAAYEAGRSDAVRK
jgi:hypothetical protein